MADQSFDSGPAVAPSSGGDVGGAIGGAAHGAAQGAGAAAHAAGQALVSPHLKQAVAHAPAATLAVAKNIKVAGLAQLAKKLLGA